MHRICVIPLALWAGTAIAGDCDHERRLDESLDLSGATQLRVAAAAGDLDIEGQPGLSDARVVARLCASSEDILDETAVTLVPGADAQVTVDIPDTSGGFFGGNRYAWVDLEIRVPERLALDVRDSSGDLEIENVAALTLQDSSGDIDVSDIAGPVILSDSSGDIEIEDVLGDVHIRADSSGGMSGREISGSVLVSRDSSGGIRFEDVEGDVIVEKDSSGGITVENVGGDFRVLRDGSGGIRHSNVRGEVEIPVD